MPQRPRSSATTPATTSSPGWSHRTRTRPRPWWTSSKPCAGTTSPPWPQRETTGRAAWTRSSRSPEKTVSFSSNFHRFSAPTLDSCINSLPKCLESLYLSEDGFSMWPEATIIRGKLNKSETAGKSSTSCDYHFLVNYYYNYHSALKNLTLMLLFKHEFCSRRCQLLKKMFAPPKNNISSSFLHTRTTQCAKSKYMHFHLHSKREELREN